jgi:3-hydroxypropanoate dehydrogenase
MSPTLGKFSAPAQRKECPMAPNTGKFFEPLSAVTAKLFTEARSYNGWVKEDVRDSQLKEIYDLLKWGPTSANSCPARFVFLHSSGAKEKLLPCMDAGNVEKTKAAPIVTIIAQDNKFYEKLPQLFPHANAKSWFEGNEKLIEETAFRNSTLQGAYFLMATRLWGLDCGPMSGFDKAKVDEIFLKGTSWRSNFICAIGYGDSSTLFPRSPRLEFEEACKIL